MTHFKLRLNAIFIIAEYAFLAGVLGLFISNSQAADTAKTTPPKAALTVTLTQAVQSQLPMQQSANGNIAAWQEALIGSEAVGLRLAEVNVNVGDSVRQGQVLARFASESVQADVAQARASLMEAEATSADAQNNAERARTLQSTGALSEQQINQYQTAAQTAKARVEAVKAMLTVQQQRLKNTQVLAPDSGVISSRSATVGAVLGSGVELFRMIRKGRLEWRAEVTSAELGRISAGTLAKVTTAGGTPLKGRVRMVAPTVDPQTRAALVYVDLTVTPAQANSVKAGMFAKGEFELGVTSALTVLQTAVLIRDGFSYVYRVGADNRVARVKVVTGRQQQDRVEIVSGITPDARLVASGAGFLNDGDLVRVVEEKPQKSATTPTGQAQPATK